MKKMTYKNGGVENDGFSLVELLVVVVIIGILSVFAVPRYLEAVNKAQVSKQKAVIVAIERAKDELLLQQARTGNGVMYPAWFNGLTEANKLGALVPYLSRNGVNPTLADLLNGTGKTSLTVGSVVTTGTGRISAAFGG